MTNLRCRLDTRQRIDAEPDQGNVPRNPSLNFEKHTICLKCNVNLTRFKTELWSNRVARKITTLAAQGTNETDIYRRSRFDEYDEDKS